MASELPPDRFCRGDGSERDELFVKRSPYSLEIVVYSLLFLAAIALVTFTVIRTRKRISDFRAETRHRIVVASIRPSTQNTIGYKSCSIRLPLRKEEFFALFLVCLCQFLLCIRLFVGLMNAIPQFEDSLVTDKVKDEDLSGEFGALMQWCHFQVATMTLLPPVTGMLQMMVFATRLLGIFNSGPQTLLRLPKRVTQIIYASLVSGSLIVLLQTAVMLSAKYSCVKVWKPPEDSSEYYACGMNIEYWLATFMFATILIGVFFNIFILALYFERFSKMLNSRRRSTVDGAQYAKDTEPILKAMEKLTVLGTTAIGSSFVILVANVSVLLVFGVAQYWMWAVDMFVNNMCLLLVFKWTDDVYIALFWHRFCCVVSCVRGVMGVQLGLKKAALGNMLGSGTKQTSMKKKVFSKTSSQKSVDTTNTSEQLTELKATDLCTVSSSSH